MRTSKKGLGTAKTLAIVHMGERHPRDTDSTFPTVGHGTKVKGRVRTRGLAPSKPGQKIRHQPKTTSMGAHSRGLAGKAAAEQSALMGIEVGTFGIVSGQKISHEALILKGEQYATKAQQFQSQAHLRGEH